MSKSRVLGQLYALPAKGTGQFEPLSTWSRPRLLAALQNAERRLGQATSERTAAKLWKWCRQLRQALAINGRGAS
jgi:hypothetical protein